MSIDNDLLHCGIESRHLPVYSTMYMSFFFLATMLSQISSQLYKIESSYLVNLITATSCIVGEPAFFYLFLSVFHFFHFMHPVLYFFVINFLATEG